MSRVDTDLDNGRVLRYDSDGSVVMTVNVRFSL